MLLPLGTVPYIYVVIDTLEKNIALIVATIIALPVGRASQRNDGHFIFANVENLTTWPTGWAFMLAWLSRT